MAWAFVSYTLWGDAYTTTATTPCPEWSEVPRECPVHHHRPPPLAPGDRMTPDLSNRYIHAYAKTYGLSAFVCYSREDIAEIEDEMRAVEEAADLESAAKVLADAHYSGDHLADARKLRAHLGVTDPPAAGTPEYERAAAVAYLRRCFRLDLAAAIERGDHLTETP